MAIISMLRTTFPGCDDGSYRRVFKALLLSEKEEKKKVLINVFLYKFFLVSQILNSQLFFLKTCTPPILC